MKKLLSLVLSLLMVCALLPVGVFAGTRTESDFDIRNGVLYKYNGTDAVVTVPDGITEIRRVAFFENQTIKEVVLPDSVTAIGNYAFARCKNLEKINLPDALVSIGSNAFASCKKLATIALPDGLEVIGSAAFSKTALKQVTIPASVTLVENYAFHSCKKLAEIVIPESLTNFYTDSFKDTAWYEKQFAGKDFHILNGRLLECSDAVKQQERVVLPEGIIAIGENLFAAPKYDPNYAPNETIVEVVIPDTVRYFEKECFAWCRNLKTLTIPDAVTELPAGMFMGCSSLEQIDIPAGVTKIGGNAFEYCSSLTEIVLPDSITEIGSSLFDGCQNLKKVNIPAGVTKIGGWAFSGCSMTEVVIPDSVTAIGNEAFFYCAQLEKITIPKTVTDFGWYVFGATPWFDAQYKQNGTVIVNRVLMSDPLMDQATKISYIPDGVTAVVCEGNIFAKAVVVPPSVTDMSKFGFGDSATGIMYGVKGSYAEQVAKEKNMDFVPLSLNKTTLSLSKGKTYQLKFNAGSDAAWKSSNSKVVSVSKTGKITAKANGTATITATLYGKKYICKVTVQGHKTYTVKRGDTLWGIASKQLGNGRRYTEIMKLNGLKSTKIVAGQKLKLPER